MASFGFGLGLGVSSPVVRALGSVPALGPEATTLPSVSGSPVVGQTLTGSDGTWTGTGAITYSREWLRAGVPISGATTGSYTLVEADEGSSITFRVTATDSEGSTVRAAYTSVVTHVAPTAAGTLADQTLTQDTAMTPLDVSADFTGSGITYALAPSSAALPAGLSLSSAGILSGTPASTVATRSIVVRGTNSGGFADSAFSMTVNAPADTVAPVITGSSAVNVAENSTAVGTYTADEAVTWSLTGADAAKFQITSGGVLSFISAPDFEAPTDTGANNVYDVVVNATDAASNVGTLAVAVTVTNLNDTPPVNTVLPAITGTATQGQTLTASTGSWDYSPTGYSYQWRRGGANISGATASTYALVAADVGATITVQVTATNASGSASATSSGVGPVASSAWSPSSLFASGEQGAWYDPSDMSTLFQDSAGTTPVTAAGQPVGRILDKSGRGNHATQATAAARPTYQVDGNGKPYLSFDGVDDKMRVAYATTLAAITRSVAYRVLGQDFILDDDNEANRASLVSVTDGDLRWGINTADAVHNIVGTGGWTRGTNLVAIATAAADKTMILEGTGTHATGTASTAPAGMSGITLGAAGTNLLPLEGRIYGVIDVGRVLTAGERADVETYLAAKAGVAL